MKNDLNYELLEFHIREAAEELDSLLSRIQFMLGRPNKAGELQVDVWRDLNEVGLEVSLAHAYHHMNFAWNVRNKTTKEADRDFDRNEKFPRPTGLFDSFARYWPNSRSGKSKTKAGRNGVQRKPHRTGAGAAVCGRGNVRRRQG